METAAHQPDPDGDVMLLVHGRTVEFAVWDEATANPTIESLALLAAESKRAASPTPFEMNWGLAIKRKKSESDTQNGTNESAPDPNEIERSLPPVDFSDAVSGQNTVKVRVSSRHLVLASPYFKRMLRGGWKETQTLNSEGCVSIGAWQADHDALLILMDIIHGHIRRIPRAVSLEMLAKIAILVDYYECFEATELFTELWINGLLEKSNYLFTRYSRDILLWICVCSVFKKQDRFRWATRIAMTQSRAPVSALGLPISGTVIDNINQRRDKSIGRIVDALHDLLKDLRKGRGSCSIECDAILLGTLIKDVDRMRLLPLPAPPFLGFSYEELSDMSFRMKPPTWYSTSASSKSVKRHRCSVHHDLFSVLHGLNAMTNGLELGTCD